jgi:hypothetical protein
VDSIVEDNKDGDRSQTKGEDYIHSYMKQGLGGSQSCDRLKMMKIYIHGSIHRKTVRVQINRRRRPFEEKP